MEKILKGDEEIRIAVKEFKGKAYVDIRTFWSDESGQFRPSKKGITVPLGLWNEFVSAVTNVDTTKIDKDEDIQ